MFDLTASLKSILNVKVSSRIPLPTRYSFAALRAGHLPPGGRDAPAALSTLNDNLSDYRHLLYTEWGFDATVIDNWE